MKLLMLFVANTIFAQTTLAQWNFNGADAASVPGGGNTPTVAVGSGTIELVGGVASDTTPFASGISATTASTDPTPGPTPANLAWVTTNYPALGTGNKTAGVQVNVSTLGFADITFKFDQRISKSANNTYVIQYTTNRTAASPVWVDAQTFTFTPIAGSGDIWYNLRAADLSAVTGLDNNPNVAFRVVSAFDPTTGNYLAADTASATGYVTTGKCRFDMVTVSAMTTLSNSDFELSKVKLYPNPVVNGKFFIETVTDVERTITVFDVLGKQVLNTITSAKEINVSGLNAGVYLIKITEEGNAVTKKLIIE
jgi:hypothetical protein